MSGFIPGYPPPTPGGATMTEIAVDPAGQLEADCYALIDEIIPVGVLTANTGAIMLAVNGIMEPDANGTYRVAFEIFPSVTFPPIVRSLLAVGVVATLGGFAQISANVTYYAKPTVPNEQFLSIAGVILDEANALLAPLNTLSVTTPALSTLAEPIRIRFMLEDSLGVPPTFGILWGPNVNGVRLDVMGT